MEVAREAQAKLRPRRQMVGLILGKCLWVEPVLTAGI
jgi:hypothetical protein